MKWQRKDLEGNFRSDEGVLDAPVSWLWSLRDETVRKSTVL